VSVASVQHIDQGVKWVARKLDINPAWAWAGLVVVALIAGYFILRSAKSRELIAGAARPVGGFLVQTVHDANEAKSILDERCVPAPKLPVLEQRVAKVPAASSLPLGTKVVTIAVASDALGSEPVKSDVEGLLEESPCFEGSDRGWQLAIVCEPPSE